MPEPLVLLHGFGGTHRAWDQVLEHLPPERYRPVARPDLPGHGGVPAGAEVSLGVDEPAVLCGYSMGGRLALEIALDRPGAVTRLILVSATAGIEGDAARAERRAADEQLARDLEHMPAEAFADRWQAQPIFDGTPADAARVWRQDLLRSDPPQLAAALRRFGQGVLPARWHQLSGLSIPVTVVVGERDGRYRLIADRLCAALPDATLHVIPGAGHGLPREAPAALAAAIG